MSIGPPHTTTTLLLTILFILFSHVRSSYLNIVANHEKFMGLYMKLGSLLSNNFFGLD